mmetsp:Transcript_11212/g.52023  ORF Transcript_11212/g.52023 Transcript_11212/m.52023 type:complete len:291 (-) Transcript_11212:724-1596(-)
MTADAMALDTNAPELAYCASISAMIPCASDAQISRTSESAICLHMASLRNAPCRVCSRLLSRKEYSVGCVATLLTTTSQISLASSRHMCSIVPPTLSTGVFIRSVAKSVSPVYESVDCRYLSRAATGMCASFIFSNRSFALAGTYVSLRLSPPPPSSLTSRATSSSRFKCLFVSGCSGNMNGDTGRWKDATESSSESGSYHFFLFGTWNSPLYSTFGDFGRMRRDADRRGVMPPDRVSRGVSGRSPSIPAAEDEPARGLRDAAAPSSLGESSISERSDSVSSSSPEDEPS